MTRRTLIVSMIIVGMAIWCSPLFAQPTIEEVYLFPERYAGQTLIFEDAWVHGEVRRDEGAFLLYVQSPDGKLVYPHLSPFEGLAFTTSAGIAESMVKDRGFKSHQWTGVRLTCHMEQVRMRLGHPCWTCNVSSMAILAKSGKVMQVFPSKPKPTTSEKRAAP